MASALTIIFFIFGLIIGSFLNVVVCRYNTRKSLGGRSACVSCQNKLCWYELIPLASFLGLRGRCIHCKSRISGQYPAVEFITGLVFALLFLKFQNIFYLNPLAFLINYIYYITAFSILIVIAVYDLKHKIIPDSLSLIFGILAFGGLFFTAGPMGFYFNFPLLWEFLPGIIMAFLFAFIWLVSAGSAMGLGDAKLALGLGWLLGLSKMVAAFLLSIWSGAILGTLLIVCTKKYGMKSQIPFAPFLVLGSILAFLFEFNFLDAFH